jgi:hypothetical protein
MLQDDSKKYPNEGLEALAKEVPEVVKRMGYRDGESVVESLNSNPRVVLNGLEVAIQSKMLDLQDAQKNKDVGQVESISQEINDLDRQRILIKNELAEERPGMYKGGSMDASMDERNTWQEGGDVDEQMSELMGPTHTMPDGTVMPGATHGESEMEPDDVMEDNYLDFIIDEALSEEEEDMLMSKLEQDEELSMLFDKVIEVASEFAGSGPVEGPGTGVSDSIPARLSDGEFVFTAKAVEEIGADNLMAMMKDAEARADERQPVQTGGLMQQDEEAYQPTAAPMTEQVIRVERGPQSETVGVAGSMLDPQRGEETNPLYEEMAFKRPPVHGAGY